MGCVQGLIEPDGQVNATIPQRNSAAVYPAQYSQPSSVPPQPQYSQFPQISQIKVEGGSGGSEQLIVSDTFVMTKRGKMLVYSKDCDDFLDHHLSNEIMLSRWASASNIRKRQIVEHIVLSQLCSLSYGPNNRLIPQFVQKAWLQRILLDVFDTADREFFKESKSIDDVRSKLAERYLFELYQLKEFKDAGLGKFSTKYQVTQVPLSDVLTQSDAALFPVLSLLKANYPQVADNTTIKFPEIKELKNDVNLLGNFPSKCFSDPTRLNMQTIYSDLKFLIDKSLEDFADFKTDMLEMLGQGVLVDSKVKKNSNGKGYTASPVRRVFIKWAETIIERIPDIIYSEAFLDFIRSKKQMADNFYFKSTVQPTTHKMVIKCLSDLLQTAKYDLKTGLPHPGFGFYIYDLLRCKTKRNTGEEISALLDSMKAIKITKSGKKFEVIRVKNRFKTPNRDLMVNFRYGDVIVGQAQLCIDTSEADEHSKHVNKFNHYIYELERGLFGPTFELIMQYEDFARTDIVADLQAEGMALKRKSKVFNDNIRPAGRKCFSNHDMLLLKGNYFMKAQDGQYQSSVPIACDYCGAFSNTDVPYDYCYFCTLVFCRKCLPEYQKDDIKSLKMLVTRREILPEVQNEAEIIAKISNTRSLIVVLYLRTGAANNLYLDMLTYLFCTYKLRKLPQPVIVRLCASDPEGYAFSQKYDIKRFPATLVLDSNLEAHRTIIGASITEIEGCIFAQQSLAKNRSKAVPIICFATQQTQIVELPQNYTCDSCWGANKGLELMSMLGFDQEKGFVCPSNHIKCMACAYAGSDEPARYRDPLGKSYLSVAHSDIELGKCPQQHFLSFEMKTQGKMQFNCFRCKKMFLFSDQDGMGFCKICNIQACPSCINIQKESFENKRDKDIIELVSHLCESTAEEGHPCICGRLFKKVYSTRLFVKEQKAKDDDDWGIMNAFIQKKNQWTCIICQKIQTDGELHLACYLCPYLLKMGLKRNIQICLKCSVSTKLLAREIESKVDEIKTELLCPKNHPVVKTTRAYKDSLVYSCAHCKKDYYPHTERYYCYTCQSDCCIKCSQKNLHYQTSPPCYQTCEQKHNLSLLFEARQLGFCSHCRIVIKGPHYICSQQCDFQLCLRCAANPYQKPAQPKQQQQQQQQEQQESDNGSLF